jgi:putative oxidoreductase
MELLKALRDRVLEVLGGVQWLAPLIARLAVGLVFMSTGWGKVHNLAKVTSFFQELGIPAPGLNAVVVGYTELIGGTFLVAGLLARLASIPLIVSMVVAILTAKRAEIHGLFDLVGMDEFTYLCVFAMIVVLGPGKVSLDAILVRKLGWSPPPDYRRG